MKIMNRFSAFFLFAINLNGLSFAFAQDVIPWLTTGDQSVLLQAQSALTFGTNALSASATITINASEEYQSLDGFGFCLTEGSAEVISTMAATQKNALLNELFNISSGLGLSVLRISLGSSDLSSSNYSYNEHSGDVNMGKFSLRGPDLTYLVPVLKSALAINPDIKILATPWTAPRWMKTNQRWRGGKLRSSYYTAYANYFVKYIEAMKAQGITIWAITPQNEPGNHDNNPSMTMSSREQLDFINNNLGPAFAAAGHSSVKIIAFDHNYFNTTYPDEVSNNSPYVDGSAFHLYAGSVSDLTTVKNVTEKNVYLTEQYTASWGGFSLDLGWHLRNFVIGGLNNWAKTVIEWNLANDSQFGPHTKGGCTSCMGAITVTGTTTYTRNVSYYIIGQISKFVRSGAVRVGTYLSGHNLMASAFKNPDGTMAVLIYNNNKFNSQSVKLVVDMQSVIYTIPKASAVTLVWTPAPKISTDYQANTLNLLPALSTVLVKLGSSKPSTNLRPKFKMLSPKLI
jgi:glucosylceramidase